MDIQFWLNIYKIIKINQAKLFEVHDQWQKKVIFSSGFQFQGFVKINQLQVCPFWQVWIEFLTNPHTKYLSNDSTRAGSSNQMTQTAWPVTHWQLKLPTVHFFSYLLMEESFLFEFNFVKWEGLCWFWMCETVMRTLNRVMEDPKR